MNQGGRFGTIWAIAAAVMAVGPAARADESTTITYQGWLGQGGIAVTDTADFVFSVWDAEVAGSQIGVDIPVNNVAVLDGLFTATVDIRADILNGEPRWLEIDARTPSGAGAFGTMSPRQAVTPAPYAIQARGMYVADNLDVDLVGTLFIDESTGVVTVNRQNRIGSEWFGVHSPTTGFGGMYVSTEAGGEPFYGYAAGGAIRAYHYFDDDDDSWQFFVGGATRLYLDADTYNLGIATTVPDARLDVFNNFAQDASEFTNFSAGFAAIRASSDFDSIGIAVDHNTDNQAPAVEVNTTGHAVGLDMNINGGISQAVQIDVTNGQSVVPVFQVISDSPGGNAFFSSDNPSTGSFALAGVNEGGGVGVIGLADGTTSSSIGVLAQTGSSSSGVPLAAVHRGTGSYIATFGTAGDTDKVVIDSAGDVGIGSANPAYTLDVRDDLSIANLVNIESTAPGLANNDMVQIEAAGSSDDIQFIECERGTDVEFRVWGDGDVTADGAFFGGGADFAEVVRISTGAASVEAGDVLVIDVNGSRSLVKSAEARSTLVAGVYSTQPGVVASEHDWDEVAAQLGLTDDDGETGELTDPKPMAVARAMDEVPVAVVGIVPTKVTNENGPIRAGDLLVTSSTPGHAMRDDNPRAGTILGKALDSFDGEAGVIRVLVTLQ